MAAGPSAGVMIELRALDRKNWRACASLQVAAGQEDFVATNLRSIAESRFEPHYRPRAILADDVPVGFLMYCVETDPPDAGLYWLFRFMIAAGQQGKGYGSRALELAIAEMRRSGARRVRTMHRPHNMAASRLYARAGFVEVGMLDDGDRELELELWHGLDRPGEDHERM